MHRIALTTLAGAAMIAGSALPSADAAVMFDFSNNGNDATTFTLSNNSDPALPNLTVTVTSTTDADGSGPGTTIAPLHSNDNNGFGIGTAAGPNNIPPATTAEGANLGANETFTITFNQAVILDTLRLGGFETNGIANDERLTFAISSPSGSGTIASIGMSGNPSTSGYSFPANTRVDANVPISFTANAGRFRFDQITVSAVPEPASMALLALGAAAMLGRVRR